MDEQLDLEIESPDSEDGEDEGLLSASERAKIRDRRANNAKKTQANKLMRERQAEIKRQSIRAEALAEWSAEYASRKIGDIWLMRFGERIATPNQTQPLYCLGEQEWLASLRLFARALKIDEQRPDETFDLYQLRITYEWLKATGDGNAVLNPLTLAIIPVSSSELYNPLASFRYTARLAENSASPEVAGYRDYSEQVFKATRAFRILAERMYEQVHHDHQEEE